MEKLLRSQLRLEQDMSVKRNKGLTLINSIIALYIFTLVFMALLAFNSTCLKRLKAQEDLIKGTYYLEGLKNIILCNYSYDNTRQLFNKNTWYINDEPLKGEELFEKSIENYFLKEKPSKFPYMSISGREDESHEVMIIGVEIVFQDKSYEVNFSRGNYEKK